MRNSSLLKILTLLFTSLMSIQFVSAQGAKFSNISENVKLIWLNPGVDESFGNSKKYLRFQGANYDLVQETWVPIATYHLKLTDLDGVQPKITSARFVALSEEELEAIDGNAIAKEISLRAYSAVYRKEQYVQVELIPLRKTANGQIEKLVEFEWSQGQEALEVTGMRKTNARSFVLNSVLRSGNWFKYGITSTGVHHLSYDQLKADGVIEANVPSDAIRIFGNSPGILPFENSEDRPDDLNENAIKVVDGGDGVFNSGDYVLFYAKGAHQWNYREADNTFRHRHNYMSDTAYYYVTTDYFIGSPKRIQEQANIIESEDEEVKEFLDYAYYENDLVNLIKSGRLWFGERFNMQKNYAFPFSFPNTVQGSEAFVRYAAASRVLNRSSSFTLDIGGMHELDMSFPTGVTGSYEGEYAKYKIVEDRFNASGSNFKATVTYNNPSTNDYGWLDYIEINALRELKMAETQMLFRHYTLEDGKVYKFTVGNVLGQLEVWDVSNLQTVKGLLLQSSGTNRSFLIEGKPEAEFVAFTSNAEFLKPQYFGKIKNQDLHGLTQADYLIVVHPNFISEAERLAEFHREQYGYKVHVVTTKEVYNEFSSGQQDITAIKDFVKMFYDRAGLNNDLMPKYLLLFGDGSYDLKYRYSGNTNFIASYQSYNSTSPTGSYVSDDYFGLLDDSESDLLTDKLDIGVGRFPVKTKEEARTTVNKIINYHNKSTFGPWRNWVSFNGDDEDGNTHMQQANRLANQVIRDNPVYNVEKVMFDAYPQETNAGGQTYPDVNRIINNRMANGCLFWTYLGHGGELGLSHERVLGIPDIKSWNNASNLPLFLTATCEFSRFDDPQRTSAGELTLLNPTGGAIALLTTTRLVFSGPNYDLSVEFMNHVFDFSKGEEPTLGDLLVASKANANSGNLINYRNFTLLGDPAMRLAYPRQQVFTTFVTDTARTLEEVEVRGYVADRNGNKLNDFSGIIYPTIFGKEQEITTLNNDNISAGPMTFKTRPSVIFKGRATVSNGDFSFKFAIPRDVGVDVGSGRISYYAENAETDAHGFDESFYIGGISDSITPDDQGPVVQIWMNDSAFVSGGITDQQPKLLARLFDANGINTVGTGVGHDITAILDENTANAIVLNDNYEADLDSYKKGTVTYDFSELEPGSHTLTLKAWDTHNNAGSTSIDFVVTEGGELILEHVLNYPNPFTTNTEFWFEHNAPGQFLEVRVSVYTVSGKLVKVIDSEAISDGFRYGPILWDGKDQFGDLIGRGTYFYTVEVKTPTGERVRVNQKLVKLQ